MSQAPLCVNPVVIKKMEDDPYFQFWVDYSRKDPINQVRPYQMELEVTSKCGGSCGYCYASSTNFKELTIPKEKVFSLIDEAYDLGVRVISWCGGDPLVYPDWYEVMSYATDKGIANFIVTSSLISKKDAKRLMELIDLNKDTISIHISTINPEAYAKVHTNPKTLEKKIQGYRNILEAGYPADKVVVIMTMTQVACDTAEETVDWYVDEMGARCICMAAFKVAGFGDEHKDWEPSKTCLQKAVEHRAKRFGKHWLRIGSSDGGFFYCRTEFGVTYDGDVVPCTPARFLPQGNIYRESLKDIFERGRDTLLYNQAIKGVCGGECENADICFGCRLNAYFYTGDILASDPKCYLNPEAPEYVFSDLNK